MAELRDRIVDDHLSCVGCGYDLFGQPFDGHCPECGLCVDDTLAQGPHPMQAADRLAAFAVISLGASIACFAMLVLMMLSSGADSAFAVGLAGVSSLFVAIASAVVYKVHAPTEHRESGRGRIVLFFERAITWLARLLLVILAISLGFVTWRNTF